MFRATNEYFKNERILFCNITYMKDYCGIDKNDKPINGGQYIKDTGDAFEKYNFLKCPDNCARGFVETKYHGGYASKNRIPNDLHIEKIDSTYKDQNMIKNVIVVFCAKSPIVKKTVIVGWYRNATVFRSRKKFGERQYNLMCRFDDAILLREYERNFIVPRAQYDGLGFGQSNLWYANSNKEQLDFSAKVMSYINGYKSNNSNKEEIIKNQKTIRDNLIQDELINSNIAKSKINDNSFVMYSSFPILRKEPFIKNGGEKVYKRSKTVAVNALVIAKHKCEIDCNHITFTRKSDGLPYMESHHLIPMAFQDDFIYSLDVEENIVSLCSNCHNEIHYGENSEELITKLFKKREKLLKRKNIEISLEKLLEYYKKI